MTNYFTEHTKDMLLQTGYGASTVSILENEYAYLL